MTEAGRVSGDVQVVAVDDLFFSMTDDRGIITHANTGFVKYARHPPAQLRGAPHNIIRHPKMPAGVFFLMWETLRAGRPFSGYTYNLAADGSTYSVYATVTPMDGGGYLSVRLSPQCPEWENTANAVYATARQQEEQLRSQGLPRRDIARRGAEHLGALLRDAGFASYEEFQWATLPAEIARHDQLSVGLPLRPSAAGSEAADALELAHHLRGALDSWFGEQALLAELSESLQQVGAKLGVELGATLGGDDDLLAVHAASDPHFREALQVWTQMQPIVRTSVRDLTKTIHQLRLESERTRFSVALAHLQATMTATFLAEVVDRGAGGRGSVEEVVSLTAALRQGLRAMQAQTAAHRALTASAISALERTSSIISIPRTLLLNWASEAPAVTATGAGAAIAAAVSEAIHRTGGTFAEFTALARRCHASGQEHDSTRVAELLTRLEESAARLGVPRPAPDER